MRRTASCHGPFNGVIQYHSKVDGSAWIAWWGPTSVHGGHEEILFDGTTYYNGCGVCHMWDNFPVKIKSSRGAAPYNTGCLVCHGRVEGTAGAVTVAAPLPFTTPAALPIRIE